MGVDWRFWKFVMVCLTGKKCAGCQESRRCGGIDEDMTVTDWPYPGDFSVAEEDSHYSIVVLRS